ncbi:MAG TPA: replication-relaxation family protein [Solirubrobacteraceae bacterium]|nr:replication-relaxation family protein [Solirubrobacteraceae bacterium]
MSARASNSSLPITAGVVLESLYQHRLLSSSQLHRMHTPTASARWTRRILTGLKRHALIACLRAADGDGSVYYLTVKGARAVESIGTPAQARRKVITREHAMGPLRAHTLAVNETGLAFLLAARERGDDFGPLAWQHEIAHPIGTRRGQVLIADALLSYLRFGDNGKLIFETRLLELDRGTLPTDTLAVKLARYARVYHYTSTGHSSPDWKSRYPVFPGVICVLAGLPQAALERRAQVVLALCRADHLLASTPEVEVSLALLTDLRNEGPFAAIWQRPDRPQIMDWLGRAATSEGGREP